MENKPGSNDSLDCIDDSLNSARGLTNGIMLSIPLWGLIYLFIYIFF
jgi:hypothetical protein